MSKTIQIRDIGDEVYAALAVRAAEMGVSVPELLRKEAAKLAARPTANQWLERLGQRSSDILSDDVASVLDESRGPWPDAGR